MTSDIMRIIYLEVSAKTKQGHMIHKFTFESVKKYIGITLIPA